jgi:hypothetical protein
VAHRVLRNAGFLPPEVEARREIADASALLRDVTDDRERRRAVMRLALLTAKLEAEGRQLPLDYRDRMAERLGRDPGADRPGRPTEAVTRSGSGAGP